MKTDKQKSSGDREILSSRIMHTSREELFRAYKEPDHLAVWWGPKGFTNTFQEFDLRPGGAWHLVMHGPDGTDYPNESVFSEVSEPSLIAFRHISPPKFQMKIELTEQDGGTLLQWRMLFDSAEICEKLRPLCTGANEENFDRLEAELARMALERQA